MAHDNTIKQLNHLAHVNKEAEAALRNAGETVKNSELETLFGGIAKQHLKFAADLQQEIRRLKGNPEDTATPGGALQRAWMDLKAALASHTAASLFKSCATGEQAVESAYLDAIEENPSGQTHTLIEKQHEQIQGFRSRLERLIGETKDGVDFQKNE